MNEERRDMKAEVVILKKDTEEIVDRWQEYWDNAERTAKRAIQGKKELKYRIYKVY
jgi:hypothetical protein